MQNKQIIEALLFATEKPISIEQIREILGNSDDDPRNIRAVIDELKAEYAKDSRAFDIIEVAGGFQLATDPAFAPWLKKMFRRAKEEHLSRPSLETLAIIAYKQPISRVDIEHMRGVDTSGVLKTLLEKGLIKILGRKDVPGRPIIYGTTKEFLQYFGLNSISQLPKAEEIESEHQSVTQSDRLT